MKTSFSLLKIFFVVFLSFIGGSIFSHLLIDTLGAKEVWLIYLIQYIFSYVLLELGVFLFDQKLIISSLLSNFDFNKYYLGVATGSVFLLISQIYSIVFDAKTLYPNNSVYVLVFALIFTLSTFVEELIYRRFLIVEFSKILPKYKKIISIFLAALVFASVHIFSNGNLIDIFNLFLFGIFLGLVYTHIESRYPNRAIWWTSGFHLAWNLSYFILGIQFENQSLPEQTLSSYEIVNITGTELSFWVNKIGILVILIFGIAWMWKKESKQLLRD